MQPHLVKKPLITNNSREDCRDIINYNSPNVAGQSSLRTVKKKPSGDKTQASVLGDQTKRIKSATRQSLQGGNVPTELNSNRPSDANSTIKKLKVKKRGHSENIHTDGSSKV